jgi:hypothetical protein
MGWFRFWRLHRIRLPARATPADFEGLGISKKPMQCCLFLTSVGVTVKSAEAGNVSDPRQARDTPDVHLQELRGTVAVTGLSEACGAFLEASIAVVI